jgi:hypothetical protein
LGGRQDDRMATIREYFDSDVHNLSVHADWAMQSLAREPLPPVISKIVLDLDANAKHWRFYVPTGNVQAYINTIFIVPETERCVLSGTEDGALIESGFAEYSERASSSTLMFTRRIILYVDAMLTIADRQEISRRGAQRGFHVIVRDREYARMRSELEKPLAFISHDSRDKDSLVRQLAHELSKLMCPVWYDEYSLQVGASLRASIESGLKETKKCIVVLSPHFLSNEGWGKAEFDSVYTREILEKQCPCSKPA